MGKLRGEVRDGRSGLTRRPLVACLWALAVYAGLTASSVALIGAYGRAMLPFYRWELSTIAPGYEIRLLTFDQAETTSELRDAQFKIAVRDSDHLRPGDRASMLNHLGCRVSAMPGLQHLVLVLLIPFAWPGLAWRVRLFGVAAALPLLAALEWADTPWVIVGCLDRGSAMITGAPATGAAIWANLLDSGGRLALSLACGLLACGIGYLMQQKLTARR